VIAVVILKFKQPIFNDGVIDFLEGLIVGIDGIDVQLNKIRQRFG
jgi:hypothetical protein